MELNFMNTVGQYKYAVNATKSNNKLGSTGNWIVKQENEENKSSVIFKIMAGDDLHFRLYSKESKSEIVFDEKCLFYNAFLKLLGEETSLEVLSDLHAGNKVTITEFDDTVTFKFKCSGEDKINNPVSIKNRMSDFRSHNDDTTFKERFLECCYEMNLIVESEIKKEQKGELTR